MNDIKVRDVMTNLVVTLRPQDSIREAAKHLLANRISGAPVVERGKLVGIVSEADLVSAYAPPARTGAPFRAVDPLMFLVHGTIPAATHNIFVRDVMTTDVVTVRPETGVWEAAALIDRHGVRRLPVVDAEDCVVGLLARADLVRVMARSDDDLVGSVRQAIEVLGPESFTGLEVDVSDGLVTVSGMADRKTTRDIAIRIASQVPGVLEVHDELDWTWDDTDIKPARTTSDPDPWAVGPLVKEVS